MDRAFPTMIRKDNSPKHKLQKTFHLLKSIWRKRRLFTVKGIRICRLNFRRSNRVRGPFLGSSDNYRSPITYQSVTKQNGLLFCFLFLCFFCFVFFFFQVGPRIHCPDFIFDIWLGPEKLWDFKFEKRAFGVGSCLSLYSERERGKFERKEKCN